MKTRIRIGQLFFSLIILLLFCHCDQKSQPQVKNSNPSEKKEEIKEIDPPKKEVVLTEKELKIKAAEKAFQKDLEKFILSHCSPSNKIPLDKINLSLLSDFEHSYEKTKKEDGKSFCIHELYNDDKKISRIFYTRNEGGHYSDIISLWSLNKTTNQLWQVHLFSLFGKDGYHQEVTTKIEGNKFTATELVNSKTKKNEKTMKYWKLFEDGDIGY